MDRTTDAKEILSSTFLLRQWTCSLMNLRRSPVLAVIKRLCAFREVQLKSGTRSVQWRGRNLFSPCRQTPPLLPSIVRPHSMRVCSVLYSVTFISSVLTRIIRIKVVNLRHHTTSWKCEILTFSFSAPLSQYDLYKLDYDAKTDHPSDLIKIRLALSRWIHNLCIILVCMQL